MSGKCICTDCIYFDITGQECTFMHVPSSGDRSCFAQFYELVPLCDDNGSCAGCSYYNKGCSGNRSDPAKRLQINPHEGQKQMLNSTARITVLLCGAQSGKTVSGPVWMYMKMQKSGYGDYLAVSSTFPLLEKKLQPVYIDFFEDTLGIGKFKAKKQVLEIDGGGIEGQIFFGSAKNPDSLESATALAAHLDEAGQDSFTKAAWEAVRRRLSRNQGDILISTTLYNWGWLKTDIYDQWLGGDKSINVIHFDSINSPGFSKIEWNRLKHELPPWKFDMQMRGRFTRPAGQIYSDFSNAHIIDPIPIPSTWNWHVGIDPGSVHTAVIWVAESPDHIFYIARSYLDGGMTTKEHAAKAKKFEEFKHVVRWVGGAGNEQQFRDDWTAEGIHVREPEVRDVESGIDRVIRLFKEHRLFIMNSENGENQPLIDQIRSYSRELDDNGQPTDRIQAKHNQHFCDALRYVSLGLLQIHDQDYLRNISIKNIRKSWR